jgi:hypothetical protein
MGNENFINAVLLLTDWQVLGGGQSLISFIGLVLLIWQRCIHVGACEILEIIKASYSKC